VTSAHQKPIQQRHPGIADARAPKNKLWC